MAFGGKDGTITICEAFFNPKVKITLKGHTRSITDFDWSMTNEMIISTSADQTIRVWNTKTGASLRKIPEEGAVPNCCLFFPLNNNLFFIGNSKVGVKVSVALVSSFLVPFLLSYSSSPTLREL
jgi:WD40 repeat protein